MRYRRSTAVRAGKRAAALLFALLLLLPLLSGGRSVCAETDAAQTTGTGSLSIHASVKHPYGDGYAVPDNANTTFTFEVELGAACAGKTFGKFTADDAGTIELPVKAGQTVGLPGIPAGTEVRVTGQTPHAGFSLQSASSATIKAGIVCFINAVAAYRPAPVAAELTVKGAKRLTGRAWQAGDSFTFRLEQNRSGSWLKLGERTVTAELDEDGKLVPDSVGFDFSELIHAVAFSEPGVYSFRVTETDSSIRGVTQTDPRSLFDVVVSDDTMGGTLSIDRIGTTTPETTKIEGKAVTLDLENQYAPEGSAAAVIEIQKQLTDQSGQDLLPEGAVFVLKDAEGKQIAASAPTNAVGETRIRLCFAPEDAGTKTTYTLTEQPGTIPGMQYDTAEKKLEVSVSEKDGAAVVTLQEQGAAETPSDHCSVTFTNVYDPSDASLVLTGEKQLTGRAVKEGEFTFELYASDAQFTRAEGAAPIQTAAVHADGSFAFPALSFDRVGTWHYVVSEAAGKLSGVTYDPSRWLVTVSVADVKGKLAAAAVITDALGAEGKLQFRNTYQAAAAEVTLKGKKTLTGKTLEDKQFKFDLFEANEAFVPQGKALQSVSNAADGSFSFAALKLTKTGKYFYVIRENTEAPVSGVSYDKTEYHLTLDVTDDGGGALKATSTLQSAADGKAQAAAEIVFANTYTPKAATVTLKGEKKLTGGTLSSGIFRFQLFETDSGFKPKTSSPAQTAQNDATGSFSFQTLSLTQAGTYYYLVREDTSSARTDVTYDTTQYTVTVTVKDDGKGALTAETEIRKVGGTALVDMVFTNAMKSASASASGSGTTGTRTDTGTTSPKTGDGQVRLLWLLLIAGSTAAALLLRKNPFRT